MTRLTRRRLLGGVAVSLLPLAGCTRSGTLSFSSDPARVAESTLSGTGYELTEERTPTVTREFTAAGQTREVEVTNHLAQYERSVELPQLGSQPAGLFALFTTPKINILGRTFNPIGDMSTRDLVTRLESRYEAVSIGRQVGSTTVTTLGTETTVDRYDGTATVAGTELDIYIHVTRLEHDQDFVVALGAYPQLLSGEGETINAMIGAIEH